MFHIFLLMFLLNHMKIYLLLFDLFLRLYRLVDIIQILILFCRLMVFQFHFRHFYLFLLWNFHLLNFQFFLFFLLNFHLFFLLRFLLFFLLLFFLLLFSFLLFFFFFCIFILILRNIFILYFIRIF